MKIRRTVIDLALVEHKRFWESGRGESEATRAAQMICKEWQKAVDARFPNRFEIEHGLKEPGLGQKIDLVDTVDSVAYELKASPNNIHMEIYRDVFKVLVYNQHRPDNPIRTLVFLAPKERGKWPIGRFPETVQSITRQMGVELIIQPLEE